MACRWRRFAGRPGSARRPTSIGRRSMMGCCERDAATEAARGRECQAAESGGRSEPGQGDAARRASPKALKPVRQRKLVDEMRSDWNVPIRRACHVFLLDRSTYHYKSRRPGRQSPNNGSRRFAKHVCAMAIGAFMFCCVARGGLAGRGGFIAS